MRRPIADVLRRGLESTLANWQLLLVRLAGMLATLALFAAAFFALVLPLLATIGLGSLRAIDSSNPSAAAEEIMGKVTDAVTNHWAIVLYLAGVALVALLLWTMLYSVMIAGVVRVLVDAEKAAGPGEAVRARLAVFSLQRWWSGARSRWWEVFAIYNAVWAVACLVILVPLAAAGALMLLFRGNAATVVLSCLVLFACVAFAIVVCLVAAIWAQKAIVVAEARGLATAEALRASRFELKHDLWRHLAVILILMVVSGGVGGAFNSVSFSFPFPGRGSALTFAFLLPLQIGVQIVAAVVGAAVSHWLFASLAALTLEDRR
ncbi:MAG: hypothetical protein JWN02_1175 [Acidobacteria bacterium]|nr:hypothetical protein [Acidobacteriota bacterium]